MGVDVVSKAKLMCLSKSYKLTPEMLAGWWHTAGKPSGFIPKHFYSYCG